MTETKTNASRLSTIDDVIKTTKKRNTSILSIVSSMFEDNLFIITFRDGTQVNVNRETAGAIASPELKELWWFKYVQAIPVSREESLIIHKNFLKDEKIRR